jgi:hypothetical protein
MQCFLFFVCQLVTDSKQMHTVFWLFWCPALGIFVLWKDKDLGTYGTVFVKVLFFEPTKKSMDNCQKVDKTIMTEQ